MDEENQFRTRFKWELDNRELGLVELADALHELGVEFFLADGALLGAVRAGDFLPWDSDVGLWVKAENFSREESRIVHLLISRGFSVFRGHRRNPKINASKYGEKYEIESWKLRRSNRIRWGLKIPAYLLESPGQVLLRKRVYPCPSPIEEFLVSRYGDDWRIPKIGHGTHALSSKTRWSLIKRYIRSRSPRWLLVILKKT